MRKTVSLLLVLVLLVSLFLSSGVSVLAAEGTEPEAGAAPDGESEEQEPLGDPPILTEGFDYRNVIFRPMEDTSIYAIVILRAAKSSSSGMFMRYGIAAYDPQTGKASPIPEQGWQSPDKNGRVTFNGISETYFVLTSTDTRTASSQTPDEFYNTSKSKTKGAKYVLPTRNVYNLIEPVDPADVERSGGNSVTVKHTELTREYALFETQTGQLITEWENGTGSYLLLVYTTIVPDTAVVVTKLKDGTFIKPDIPPLEPGADLAFTKAGFSPLTVMAVLTIQATPGLAYAVADENGHILNASERLQWGITAETENELNVMADETDFYPAPEAGNEIRFRVPPGGRYFVVTRLPEGTTSRVDKPYQTPAVGDNIRRVVYHDPLIGWHLVVTVIPAASYSEYAVRDNEVQKTTPYFPVKNQRVDIDLGRETKSFTVLARPIPLTTTPPGQNSPSQGPFPPVLEKSMRGFGATLEGKTIEVDPFASFGESDVAVEAALTSDAGNGLDPSTFVGAVVGLVAVGINDEAFPMVVLYDGDGKPSVALYCYDDAWRKTEDIDIFGKDYTVYFQDGLNGDVLIYNYAL